MGRKAGKTKPSGPIPEWTADDAQLAKLRLQQWETGCIVLGEDWEECFDALVKEEYARQSFPGSGFPPPGQKPGQTHDEILARICAGRLRSRITHLSKKVKKFLEICSDIRQKKGEPQTSDFVKGIAQEEILPTIQAEKQEILAEFQQYCPVGWKDNIPNIPKELDDAVSRIEKELNQVILSEVRKAEIAALEARVQPQLPPLSEKNNTPESWVPTPKSHGAEPAGGENVERTAAQTAGHPRPKSSRGRRKGSGGQATRDLDAGIREAKREGHRTTPDIIEFLERRESLTHTPLVSTWREKYGTKTWKEVRSKCQRDKHLLSAARKRFSKVKR